MGKWEKGRLRKRRPETVVLADTDGSLPQRHRGKAKTETADKCIPGYREGRATAGRHYYEGRRGERFPEPRRAVAFGGR